MPGSDVLRWSFDPPLLGTVLTTAALYLLAIGPLRVRLEGRPAPPWRVAAFMTGLLVTILAEASPLHGLGEVYLFSAHMVQHVVLAYVVPPLLIAGTPPWLAARVLGVPGVRPVMRTLTRPLVALLVFSLAFSIWHVPSIYQAALRNAALHHVEHVLFIGTALIMWWPLMGDVPFLPRLGRAGSVGYLLVLPVGQFVVSALLSFTSVSIYPMYAAAPRITALSVVEDQQLGGIVMKIASFIAFGIPLAWIFLRWAAEESRPVGRPSAAATRGVPDVTPDAPERAR